MSVFFEEHDTLDPPVKEKTPFEVRRERARTEQELVDLGYEEGMEFPEAWARHVLAARQGKFQGRW